ncbi:MAG: insulinase family protein, partial [Defluviitaleaceae bacterium]|nr:insulinase family protein [Defluviitaleaceae bacterium]
GNGALKDYLLRRYDPRNTVLSAAGNFEPDEMLGKLGEVFGGFAPSSCFFEPSYDSVYAPAFAVKEKDIEQTHMCVGFPGIPAGSDDNYAMAAVNTIFGGGMSSRLFQKIREERGLAYSVYSCNSSFTETGLFLVYAALNPIQVGEVLGLIVEETKRMLTDRITEEQLFNTKEQLKSGYLLSLESTSSRMNSIGRTMLMLNKTVTSDELIEKIDAVNLDKFYEICERVLQLDKISLSFVGPDAREEEFRMRYNT